MQDSAPAADAGEERAAQLYARARHEIGKVVFGQEETIRFCLAALFSNGHILIEGVPGVAKTTLVRTIARILAMDFGRIQFTPDLLPNDIIGTHIYSKDTGQFEFRQGPIFTNFLLADEINRAPAKTQSALLEAMQERTISQERATFEMPLPFVVFATQNPIEHEGTYPLPLAQLDRFMFKALIGYPEPEDEERILAQHHAAEDSSHLGSFGIETICSPRDLLEVRDIIRQTYVRPEVVTYVRQLIAATRTEPSLLTGASPRAGLTLLMGAKSLARFEGRDFVTPDDIAEAFLPALRHRVVVSPASELEGQTPDDVLRNVRTGVAVPR